MQPLKPGVFDRIYQNGLMGRPSWSLRSSLYEPVILVFYVSCSYGVVDDCFNGLSSYASCTVSSSSNAGERRTSQRKSYARRLPTQIGYTVMCCFTIVIVEFIVSLFCWKDTKVLIVQSKRTPKCPLYKLKRSHTDFEPTISRVVNVPRSSPAVCERGEEELGHKETIRRKGTEKRYPVLESL